MLLEKVRHPNVVQFVGAVTQNLPMMIVSEYHPKVSNSLSLSLPRQGGGEYACVSVCKDYFFFST
jgi:hypothetical protein